MQSIVRLLAGFLACVAAGAALAPRAAAAETRTAPAFVTAFNGHWRCRTDGGKSTERSYYADSLTHRDDGASRLRGGLPTVFAAGREDATDPNGDPIFDMERLDVAQNTVKAQTLEGTSEGSVSSDDTLLLRGVDTVSSTPFTLRYAVTADSLQRTFVEGSSTNDERCTREAVVPPPATCANPNVPAATLQAAEPYTPAEAQAQHVSGVVNLVVTLDDRSHVVWVRILDSASPLLNDAAFAAARDSTYRVQTFHCRPIAADYVFTVQFDKQ